MRIVFLLLLAALIALPATISQSAPPAALAATTASSTECVHPNTIGGAGLWQEWYNDGVTRYYALAGGLTNDTFVAPPSGQLTERRPDAQPLPPGKLSWGQAMAYWCGPAYPAPSAPLYGTTEWVSAYMSYYNPNWEQTSATTWRLRAPTGQTYLVSKGSLLGTLRIDVYGGNMDTLEYPGLSVFTAYAEYTAELANTATPTPTATYTATAIPTSTATATPKATNTPMPTKTATPRATNTPVSKPKDDQEIVGSSQLLTISTRKESPDKIHVHIRTTDPGNRIREIRFPSSDPRYVGQTNAQVSNLVIRDPSNGTIGVPEPFASFTVRRVQANKAMTVPFVVVTDQGSFSSFVGHGPSPF